MSDSEDFAETKPFPTYIVIEFSKKIRADTAQWIVEKITNEGRLLILRQPPSTCVSLTLHVSADTQRLLELAEDMKVTKRGNLGDVREFIVFQWEKLVKPKNAYKLLTTAEKQMLVRHALENIRALSDDNCILGYPEYPLYEGQSIVFACLHRRVIKKIYPLHEPDELNKLGTSWYARFLAPQPYEQIRLYFGEYIALYFHFLEFYTRSLIPPLALGFLQILMPSEYRAVFCLLNIICATLFLKLWRRKCSELAYTWGTISMTSFDEPRPNFRGEMGVDDVTGKQQPQASLNVTYMKMYLVSLPLVGLCMVGAFVVMLTSFKVDENFQNSIDKLPFGWLVYLPSAIYAVFIPLSNIAYRKFANFLTEWENHRSQSQFERHRVTKLVLFEFVNNFTSLFYVAFYKGNIALLKYQLALQLIVVQVINNFIEAVVPLLILWFRVNHNITYKRHKKGKLEDLDLEDSRIKRPTNLNGVRDLDREDPKISQAVNEGKMFVLHDLYDDYLELFVQFGYVFLFSAVFPMAAFWAYLNNVVEVRTDAFKLCRISQRPVSRRVKDTGAWQLCFQALCELSIMTNCVFLGFSSDLKKSLAPDSGTTEWLMGIVMFAVCLHVLRQVLHYAIPDKPEWVRVALAKKHANAQQEFELLLIRSALGSQFS